MLSKETRTPCCRLLRIAKQKVLHISILFSATGFATSTIAVPLFFQDDGSVNNEWSEDLSQLDLEDLLQIEVTSVAGVARPLQSTPAAIFVITEEDIRRGGHQTIADALRMVPGIHVGQISGNISAITARGFNSRFADKLLVLVDGRAVYNDLFAGVYWDEIDMVLEDVDRIEVIRGPGATLWGANAVNGVINIVSKNARDTQGLLLTGGGGSHEQGFGTVRYGGQISDDAYFRVYGKYFNRDHQQFPDGSDSPDDWDQFRGGFRLDFGDASDVKLMLQGDMFQGTSGQFIVTPSLTAPFSIPLRAGTTTEGHHFIAKLSHEGTDQSGWSLQAYYDHVDRDEAVIEVIRNTFDVEWRQWFSPWENHSVMWGLGYRHRKTETAGTLKLSFFPNDHRTDMFSAFIQDTIELIDDRLSLMVGSKFEQNDFSGVEIQPSARLAWTPDDTQTVWGAVSWAVRTPSLKDEDLRLTTAIVPPPLAPVPTPVVLSGSHDNHAEELLAFELGYRIQPTDDLTLDLAGFYNDYENLFDNAPTADPFTFLRTNGSEAESYGMEASATWNPAKNWRLTAGYSFLKIDSHGMSSSFEDDDPQQQFNIRSYLDLSEDLEFNAMGYFVDRISKRSIGDYFRVDLGLTWRPDPNLEISVFVQNLLDPQHPEYTDAFFQVTPIEVERSVVARVTLRF